MEKNEITKVLEGLKNLQDGGTVKDSEQKRALKEAVGHYEKLQKETEADRVRVVLQIVVTQEDIDDIMVSALEGGINYWCDKALDNRIRYLCIHHSTVNMQFMVDYLKNIPMLRLFCIHFDALQQLLFCQKLVPVLFHIMQDKSAALADLLTCILSETVAVNLRLVAPVVDAALQRRYHDVVNILLGN